MSGDCWPMDTETPHHLRDLHVRLGGHLARDVHEAGGDQGLNRNAGVRVLGEHRVQNAVGDLVTDLVRVPLGDGLGREQAVGGLSHGGQRTCSVDLSCHLFRSGTTASQTASATSSLVPAAVATVSPRTSSRVTSLCPTPNPRSGPTSFTTSRSAPLRRALARPWCRTSPVASPVSAAKPTTT